jgi:uncharacterized protein YaaN involved in tellurite resistance
MSEAMKTSEHADETSAAPQFQLTPPEVITPFNLNNVHQAHVLNAQTKQAVETQVAAFMQALLQEDVESESFKNKLDSAFALGREEVSIAASLMQGRFLQRNFVGVEDSAAFKAIQEMRGHLDTLNPGTEGDLFQPKKFLGFIPYGNRLRSYFRKYQGASGQLQKSMQQLYAARDDMQRDVLELETTRTKLWDAMQKLNGAIYFAQTLDEQLKNKVDSLQATDATRAKALEQEVLFYARQNLQDMLTQQAVCTNGYLALDVLKKTAREMMNGCSRVATTGMSALAIAQTVARATGNQIQVMEMLGGVNQSIENLIGETGRALNNHVDKTTQFAQNPMIGIDKLKEMFDQSFKAMDAMDQFRSKAIEVMGQNNLIIKEELLKAELYIDRVRQKQVKEIEQSQLAGPVAL